MKTLSVTFHCTTKELDKWKEFLSTQFLSILENLSDIDKYIFSEVHTEMIEEGKNFNLFLFFENEQIRDSFIENDLKTITENVKALFSNEVIIFLTHLYPIQYNI